MVNGYLSGKAYKEAQSALGKRIRALRNSPSADQELAGALEDFSAIMDATARRSSRPEAVALLDAADRGYAKLVRVQAAANSAGEAGRFTPSQFANAVRNQAGGKAARSQAYLRGDALMQEYADAGLRLNDKLPNSGTADRGLVAGAATGVAGTINPTLLAVPGALSVPYLPGVRTATNALLAPRSGATIKAVGNALATNRVPTALPAAVYGLDRY
jgi:hypothetical protein